MKQNRISKFFKDYKSEFHKIAWPSAGQILKNSGVVLSAIVVFTLVIGGLDALLNWLVNLLTGIIA